MSEPWVRVHAQLRKKPVVGRLAEALRIDPHKAMGHLVEFWGAVSAHASNGRIADVPDRLLEDWAGWKGRRGAFAKWLRDNHMDANGRVNEWDEYAGALEYRRARDAERQRGWRARKAVTDLITTNPLPPAPITRDRHSDNDVTSHATSRVTSPLRNGVTVRNGTEREVQDQKLSRRAHARRAASDRDVTRDSDAPPAPEPKRRKAAAAPDSPRETWLTPFVELWQARVGPVEYPRAGKALKPPVDLYGHERTLAGLTAYLDEPRPPDKPVKLEYFAADAARWIEEADTPVFGPDGQLTERAQRILGAK